MSASGANGAGAAVVLVVEDEVLIRCDVAEHLREAGYTVVETASGEEAIAMCKSDMSIDIVFTDIHLIGSPSGWDAAETVRADRPDVFGASYAGDTERSWTLPSQQCFSRQAISVRRCRKRLRQLVHQMTFWVNLDRVSRFGHRSTSALPRKRPSADKPRCVVKGLRKTFGLLFRMKNATN